MLPRLLLLATLILAGCDKASVQECDLGCRNYFTLHFHEETELLIQDVPEAERAKFRETREAELEPRLQQQLELCIQKCRSGATEGRANCWKNAKTVEDAKKCE